MDKKYCKCGCGKEIIFKSHHKYYGSPEYIHGHGNKGKVNYWSKKDTVKSRTSRERANKICKKEVCYVNNYQCSRKLHIHHIDGNEFNNNPSNLICLCCSHHRLMEKRELTLKELVVYRFRYRIDNHGKRRYYN